MNQPDPPDESLPPDLDDRVDQALKGMWKGNSDAFDQLLEEPAGSASGVGKILKVSY